MSDLEVTGQAVVSNRFEAIGSFVYEKGNRIGVTPDEASVELARKLNAYQMRIERLKTEVERLRKAGDGIASALREMPGDYPRCLANEWNAAKEGRPNE